MRQKQTKRSLLCLKGEEEVRLVFIVHKHLQSNISVITQQDWIVKISVMNWSINRRHRTHVFWLLSIKNHLPWNMRKVFWGSSLKKSSVPIRRLFLQLNVHYSSRKPLDREEVLLCTVQSENIQSQSLLVRSDVISDMNKIFRMSRKRSGHSRSNFPCKFHQSLMSTEDVKIDHTTFFNLYFLSLIYQTLGQQTFCRE